MANPSPQHTPTDGLNVAAYVQVTGTNITNCAGGGLTPGTESTPNDTTGLNGQGYGAVASTNHPVAQYALKLSLSGATIGGTAYFSTCQLTTVLKDVANTTYTTSNTSNIVYKSYNDPSAGSPAWYNPSTFSSLDKPKVNYNNGNVVSVSSSGLITALATGQAIVEVQFPTFDDVMTPQDDHTTGNPTMMIYAQIVVEVVT
jgi:hypothetical protein